MKVGPYLVDFWFHWRRPNMAPCWKTWIGSKGDCRVWHIGVGPFSLGLRRGR